MSSKNTSHHTASDKQSKIVIVVSLALLILIASLGSLMLSRFQESNATWEAYSTKSSDVHEAMSTLYRAIGYGGFIHHFKNLVLRRDLARYEQAIDTSIVQTRRALNRLESLLVKEDDLTALAEVRRTFEEYFTKYQKIPEMLKNGATSAELDAVVKVNDGPALTALQKIDKRIKERVQEAREQTNLAQTNAVSIAYVGGSIILLALLFATIIIIRSTKKVVDANHAFEQTSAQLDTLLDTAPDAMLTIAPDGSIVRSNQMASHFFGYNQQEFKTLRVEQLIPQRYRDKHPQLRDDYAKSPENRPMGTRLPLSALTKDGREPLVEISLSHTGTGEEQLVTITLRDVSEREANKLALEKARNEAESALAQQKAMQNEIIQSEKLAALGGLVAGIAHEINTPVGITLTAATHLETETMQTSHHYQAGELSEEELTAYFATAVESARLITTNSQRADKLIQSFKQVAVDQTANERRQFNLAHYLNEIITSLQPRLKKTRITVEINCPDNITMDTYPGALSQVITNFIANSLLHGFDSEQHGKITLSAELNHEQVILHYKDTGRGIPREQLHKVFEPFFTTKRNQGGSGLGLHIVHSLVTQTLNGSIKLNSEQGKGVDFTLLLPRNLHASTTSDS
jgi:PAS domain S-box-containing protein